MEIRVLEIIRQGEIGGGESHLLDLIRELKTKDIHITVVSFSRGAMTERLEAMGVPVFIVETSSAFMPAAMKAIKNIIRRERINIIHAHGSRAASNVAFVARMCNVPLVYTVHGWSFHQGQSALVYRLRMLCEKLICGCSSTVVCVSADNIESGRQAFGLKSAELIENGVNTEIFSPSRTHGIRSALGIGEDDCVVGFIGRMTLQKDPVSFLEAVKIANSRRPNIRGLLVGEGDMDDTVDKYIKEHLPQGVIIRSPFRLDIPEVLASVDIYSLCSLWEGLSIGLLEAMAMQKPVVVTPTDGSRTVIRDGENGFFVPFRSPAAMADCFIRLHDDKTLAAEAGRRAGQMVDARFNSRRVADAVYDIYRKEVGAEKGRYQSG